MVVTVACSCRWHYLAKLRQWKYGLMTYLEHCLLSYRNIIWVRHWSPPESSTKGVLLHLALSINIRLGWKSPLGITTLAYWALVSKGENKVLWIRPLQDWTIAVLNVYVCIVRFSLILRLLSCRKIYRPGIDLVGKIRSPVLKFSIRFLCHYATVSSHNCNNLPV